MDDLWSDTRGTEHTPENSLCMQPDHSPHREADGTSMEGGAAADSRPRRALWATQQRLVLDYGDCYVGAVQTDSGIPVPHGKGTLTSESGGHRYIGDFSHRWRDGYGQLTTSRFVLWSRWRMNRPDLSNSVRVDYPNGDKYCGFLTLLHQPSGGAGSAEPPSKSARASKFSMWLQAVTPVRTRWGELVLRSGGRYFGEWEENLPSGFGCYITAAGDRYVGRFKAGTFHSTGTLFSRSFGITDQAPLSGVQLTASASPHHSSLSSPDSHHDYSPGVAKGQSGARWDGVVLDGVWANGSFEGEGHVTLRCGTRVSAMWRGPSQSCDGEVVAPPRPSAVFDMEPHTLRECFHWESLLCGAGEGAVAHERAACRAHSEQLARAHNPAQVHAAITAFLDREDGLLLSATRIFTRCFYFLYGTCGASSETGAGGGDCDEGKNPLGWCSQRNAFGGCIHHAKGSPRHPGDLDLSLMDIFSFSCSVQRWALEMLAPESSVLAEKVRACGMEQLVGRWTVDQILSRTHDVLLNVYAQTYRNDELLLQQSIQRLRGCVSLDDMGVHFARSHASERLFDSYTDAIHCIEQLSTAECTLTNKLRVVMRWSKEIDLSTRLAQAASVTQQFQPGSADDLLPIHQYVLGQARVPHLYAHTRMLIDLSGESSFTDPTSQDSFCVTTLQVCVITLLGLNPALVDTTAVMVPISFVEECARALLGRVEEELRLARQQTVSNAVLCCGDAEARACHVVRGFLRLWLPPMIRWMSTPGCTNNAVVPRTAVLPSGVRIDDTALPLALRVACWTLAARVVGLVSAGLHLQAGEQTVALPLAEAASLHTSQEWIASAQLRILVRGPTPPSALLRLADCISSAL